jgi:hypothetical protein
MDPVVSGAMIGMVAAAVFVPLVILLWALLGPKPKCPECGDPPPLARKPKNRREMLWGGWTCENCGTACDRKGRRVKGE